MSFSTKAHVLRITQGRFHYPLCDRHVLTTKALPIHFITISMWTEITSSPRNGMTRYLELSELGFKSLGYLTYQSLVD